VRSVLGPPPLECGMFLQICCPAEFLVPQNPVLLSAKAIRVRAPQRFSTGRLYVFSLVLCQLPSHIATFLKFSPASPNLVFPPFFCDGSVSRVSSRSLGSLSDRTVPFFLVPLSFVFPALPAFFFFFLNFYFPPPTFPLYFVLTWSVGVRNPRS